MPSNVSSAAPAAASTAAHGSSDTDLNAILSGQPAAAETNEENDNPDHDPEHDEDTDALEVDPAADPDADLEADPEAPEGEAEAEADEDVDTEADSAADPENKDDEGLDEEDKKLRGRFTPEQQKSLDKIIAKKTRKLTETNTQLQQVSARAQQLEQENISLKNAAPAAPIPSDSPLDDIESEDALQASVAKTRTLRKWLAANRDGGEMPNGKGGVTVVSPERRDELLAEVDDLLQEAVPARREFIKKRQEMEQTTLRVFPWAADQKSAGAVRLDAAYRQYPWLRKVPEGKLLAAHVVHSVNRLAEDAAAAKAATATGKGALLPGKKTVVVKAPPGPGVVRAAAKSTPVRKTVAVASERLAKTGRDDGNTALAGLIGS